MPITTETGLGVRAHSERPCKPGLCLTAVHGRSAAQHVMQCWGQAGPLIGPLVSCREKAVAFSAVTVDRVAQSDITVENAGGTAINY